MKKTIAVWFSCGAASAVASKRTIEKYGDTHNILIVNNPVDEEDDDNFKTLFGKAPVAGDVFDETTTTDGSEDDLDIPDFLR